MYYYIVVIGSLGNMKWLFKYVYCIRPLAILPNIPVLSSLFGNTCLPVVAALLCGHGFRKSMRSLNDQQSSGNVY